RLAGRKKAELVFYRVRDPIYLNLPTFCSPGQQLLFTGGRRNPNLAATRIVCFPCNHNGRLFLRGHGVGHGCDLARDRLWLRGLNHTRLEAETSPFRDWFPRRGRVVLSSEITLP